MTARSGEIRKGQLGGIAAPSLLLMPKSRLGYAAAVGFQIQVDLCGERQGLLFARIRTRGRGSTSVLYIRQGQVELEST
jgi:hypothetical protein